MNFDVKDKVVDNMVQKNESNIANEYFECYAEFAKTLRTWFIAYGIGFPVLLFSNNDAWETIKSTGNIRLIGMLFLAGVSIQVLEALIYKNAMWYLYRGEENLQIKNKVCYKTFYYISECYLLEISLDILTLICFAIATWKVICSMM
jgi:hypothetical protein